MSQLPPDPMPPATASPGALLRQARRQRGLRLHQVAEALRTRPEIIQALESDRFEAVGTPVFARMYLANYAHLLGVPEQDVLTRFKALGIDQPAPLRLARTLIRQIRDGNLHWMRSALLVVAVFWLGWILAPQRRAHREPPSPDPAAPSTPARLAGATPPTTTNRVSTPAGDAQATATQVAAAADKVAQPASSPAEPAPATPVTKTGKSPATSASAADESATGGKPAVAETGTAQGAATTASSTLRIKVSAKCWTNVTDARGDQLVYGLLKAGEHRTVTGVPPFTIKLGNAQAATLTLDGKAVKRSLYVPKYGTVNQFVLKGPPGD